MFKQNIVKKLSLLSLVLVIAAACQQEEIDDITRVDQGEDQAAPELEITSPADGTSIETETETTSLEIAFEASDDIRIAEVTVTMDGEQIAYYDDFLDYRILDEEFIYENLTDGDHTITVTVNDAVGNTTTEMVTVSKSTQVPYEPVFDGEVFYMTFNGNYNELVDEKPITVVGTPGYAGEAQIGSNAYEGNADSYLISPIDGLTSQTISATFWYKVNATPDRAGILVIGPEDTANPESQNLRTSGFRLFREASGSSQVIKLNIGIGSGESWNDGGTIDPAAGEWVHIAFTISETESKIYIDGNEVNTGTLSSPISWDGTDIMSIMSGAPRFAGWNHLSDASYMDDLRIYNKVLTSQEINDVMQYTGE